MSSSAIPHVVAFLTRPLLSAFSPAAVSSVQLILNASLATVPSATFTLNATSTPPAPLLAASIGVGIPWAAWFSALAGGDDILLLYGPGYVKVRFGDAAVLDLWNEDSVSRVQAQVKVGPSPLFQQNTSARLRATLLSARVRCMRRERAAAEPIYIPSPLASQPDCDSDSDSDSDCSDSASSTSSKFTSYSDASPYVRRLPSHHASKSRADRAPSSAPQAVLAPVDRSKKDTTAYLYQGGVTRVMTGGVMLGPRSTRS
ncbi:Zn(2)-C6 fungal-type domain-containing protein [Mycena venus]|uniref:Zn(2)-C6 fungal-type domain-containing protein n=1 Tax=Mycena venus TaxID=2733690 RepID=A0A8H6XEQ9_9AGAR|nr:Zn(2)-C6 fungal-type domain-containing protein [Mycena venus]